MGLAVKKSNVIKLDRVLENVMKRLGLETEPTIKKCQVHGIQYRYSCEKCNLKNELAERKSEWIQSLYRSSGLGERAMTHTLDSYIPANKQAKHAHDTCKYFAKNFLELKKTGTSMVFSGKPGTGKTGLATSIMRYVMDNFGLTTKYVRANRLIGSINNTYSDKYVSDVDVQNEYKNYDLLIVDEVDKQRGSVNDFQHIFDAIDDRYDDMKSTIIISNLNIEELKKTIGTSVISRLSEGGNLIGFNWEDQRKQRAVSH